MVKGDRKKNADELKIMLISKNKYVPHTHIDANYRNHYRALKPTRKKTETSGG